MKQSSHIFLLSIFCVTFMSCNDEAFIGKLSIEPENQTLPWTGGNVCFKANQDIDMVSAIVFRNPFKGLSLLNLGRRALKVTSI